MTLDIKRLRELDEKATKGPWEESNGDGYSAWSIRGGRILLAKVIGDSPETDANAALIAAARNALPALLDAAEREVNLRQALEAHHVWHQNIGTVQIEHAEGEWHELDMSLEYSDSFLCEKTLAALAKEPDDG